MTRASRHPARRWLSKMALVLFTGLLSVGPAAHADHDRFFTGVHFPTVSEFVDRNGITVTYKGPSEEEFQKFLRVFLASEILYRDFSERENEICKSKRLTVYDIPYELLNDKQQTRFVNWEGRNRIYGFYDPVDGGPGESGMFLSYSAEIKPFQRQYIMAHESAHYWQNVLCGKRRAVTEIEAEADAFGKYYIALH